MPSIACGFTSEGGMNGMKPLPIAVLIAKLIKASSSSAPWPVR